LFVLVNRSISAGGVVEALRIDLETLSAIVSAGDRPNLNDLADRTTGLSATELLTALTAVAIRESAGDLELLHSVPIRDDAQFGDRPSPVPVTHLGAWLYSAANRVAYAVHTPDWEPPPIDRQASDRQPIDPTHQNGRTGWSALLREHLHGDFQAGRGWTPVNVVAMPVRRPFDEVGLRVMPLLSLWPPVSQHGDNCFSETMTATVRDGRPYVVAVRVFSAAIYLRQALEAGRRWVDLTAADRRPTLVG
jgi:hypothetical protein